MKALRLALLGCACAAVSVANATQYSKLSVITAAKNAGLWDGLKGWIAASGLSDEWQNCAYLSDEYPQFAAVTNAIVSACAATSAQVEAILDAAKDQAVSDVLLRRVYDADMQTDQGRSRWHGRPVETRFDTNAQVKVQVYADGYRYEQPFRSAKPATIDSRVAAAKAKAAREAAEEKRRQARIAMLTTNMTAEVSALMSRNKWPEDLARLYLETELNKLIGTRTVTATITPSGDL